MNTLQNIARALVAQGKGILAADESMGTCDKRFDKYGIPKTPEMRRKWRQLLFTTPGIERGLSGVILFDETIRQKTNEDVPFAELLLKRGIIPGIKVDQKTEPLGSARGEPIAGTSVEEVTRGLEGLSGRLFEYVKMGAQFTKWRAVIRIGTGLPTIRAIQENARRIGEYALESQRAGLVPIVEPEVLLDGEHTLARCEEVVKETLDEVFTQLKAAGVSLPGLLLKTSMVLPGRDSGEKATPAQIAEVTVRTLLLAVPKELSGIVFLSGGQTPKEATEHLGAIVQAGRAQYVPWPLTFSFSRALQDPVMQKWLGKEENEKAAQEIFRRRVEETAKASEGEFN